MASSTEAVSTPAMADHPVRAALLLGALGVVFVDIGTRPIYAFREALRAAGGPSEAAVFGVLSLVFWAIILVIAIVRQRAQDPRGRLVSAARRLYCAHSYAWRKGRRVAFEQRDQNAIDLTTFIASLDQPGAPERMNGTAVYLTKETHLVPAALELNVRHNGIVHKHVVLLKVTTEHSPRVDEGSRIKATSLSSGFRLLWLVFGFAEKPDVPAALRLHSEAWMRS
jgi:K+ transporter